MMYGLFHKGDSEPLKLFNSEMEADAEAEAAGKDFEVHEYLSWEEECEAYRKAEPACPSVRDFLSCFYKGDEIHFHSYVSGYFIGTAEEIIARFGHLYVSSAYMDYREFHVEA